MTDLALKFLDRSRGLVAYVNGGYHDKSGPTYQFKGQDELMLQPKTMQICAEIMWAKLYPKSLIGSLGQHVHAPVGSINSINSGYVIYTLDPHDYVPTNPKMGLNQKLSMPD